MPHFTAIALDRFLEPGATKSGDITDPNLRPSTNVKSVFNKNLDGRNGTSVTERRIKCPQISPALYATPEATIFPDSPSSSPLLPYIINHKRRGPRLHKISSKDGVSLREEVLNEGKVKITVKNAKTEAINSSNNTYVTATVDKIEEKHGNGLFDSENDRSNGECGGSNGKLENTDVEFGNWGVVRGSSDLGNCLSRENDSPKFAAITAERDSDCEDFFDPLDSLSVASTNEGEDNSGADCSSYLTTPIRDFFDAWEELSSEAEPQSCFCDVDAELREMRSSLLSEIEKRKQVEEALSNIHRQWQRIRQQLHLAGLTPPADPIIDEQPDMHHAEDLCQQVYVARYVADTIGRGIAKAEAEMEMEAQMESKNFEIARLRDRLNYYEGMNREMTQRNRETVEMARYRRQKRKIRQRWIWSSIATAIALSTATIAWSYLPSGIGSSSHNFSQAPEGDEAAN